MNLGMICTCRANGVREVEARRLRIFQRMCLEKPSDLTTAIVLSLAFDFGCDAYIAADMWFGLSVETVLVPDGLYVECDHPADGLAAVWEVLADRFPERVTVRTVGSIPLFQDVAKASNTFLAAYETAKAASKEHYATHGNDYKSGCVMCRANMDVHGGAHRALDSAWGTNALDPAIGVAYGE